MRPRPRAFLALGVAGLATAGLGTSVLGASAKVRTFELALHDGRALTISVDVAEDADPWFIAYPGVRPEEISDIREIATPAGVAPPAVTSTTPAPVPPGAAITPTMPVAPATPAEPQAEDDPAADEPEQAEEPAVRGRGGKQRTTGKKKARAKKRERAEEPQRETEDRPRPERSEQPGNEGLPTAADPTTSIATPGAAPIGVPNFFIDKFRIPPFLLSLYQAAGIEYGVRWEILAAINEIETDYGRNLNVSSAGALGWMQFMPATWKAYGVDANGDKRKDPYNPADAIFAAARYLRAAGADEDLRKAIFAYNHADWYVDSVLMRARIIGGLPSNLVGSLTGLTQGVFPVAARARYADDLSKREVERRVAKGRNAAVPVESSTSRRGIDIYAKPGAPVVAVQDGRIVKVGRSDRLGRYVQLRDAFGNTYTYANLKKVAGTHPVPKAERVTSTTTAPLERDPAPKRAASAGKQPPERAASERAASPSTPTQHDSRPVKERLWANPHRPQALRSGARKQLLQVADASDLALLDLPADQVELRPLRKGSRVIGGTVLGEIGRTSVRRAPHMHFEVRPAGRGAPRIDPKPILDGWKLLESTAIYRAENRNPFFGKDARQPTIGQILLMGKEELERRVLTNPRIDLYRCGARDVRTGRIDRRVLATLEFLAASGLRPTVTSLECGHSTYTASGNVSHHSMGSAVDIGRINGVPVLGHQGDGSITDLAVRRLLTLQGTMKPSQIITLMKYDGTDNTMAMNDHDDHIHIGWQPMFGANTVAGRQLSAALKPGQWIKLIDRLGELDNPVVATKPSKASIVVGGRASKQHAGE